MTSRGILILAALVAFGVPTAITIVQERPAGIAVADAEDREVYIVRTAAADGAIDADGEIEAADIVNLSFEMNGLVQHLYVTEGTYVEEGDIIAALENERQRIDVADAEVNLEIAEIQLEDLITLDDDEIRQAEAAVAAAQNSYGFIANQVTEEDIRIAELQYAAAEESVYAAREARIRGGGNMLDEGVTLLEAEIGAAQFQAEITRLQAENLRDINDPQLGAAYTNIEAAEADLARVLAGPSDFEVTNADLVVQSAEVELARAELAFERSFLVAPASGLLTNINVEEGQRIEARNTVMELVNNDPLNATVDLDEIDFRNVSVGMDALVTLDALPGVSFPATVTKIAPEGEEINGVVSYEVEVEITEADPRIRPGMSATAYFGADVEESMLVVPERFFNEDGTVNRVRTNGTVEVIPVVTGTTTSTGLTIASGLNAGDAIVTAE
ncbi:MAG: efflux RND transporter periplasmic adaptor subunit [Chloroflexota bacterium]